jgi:hypothetical protein
VTYILLVTNIENIVNRKFKRRYPDNAAPLSREAGVSKLTVC